MALGVPVSALGQIPARELTEWAVFEEEFGPLTVQERIDAMGAHVAYVMHASAGGKGKLADFMPQWKSQRALSDDNVVPWLMALAKRKA